MTAIQNAIRQFLVAPAATVPDKPLYVPFDQDDHLPPPPWKSDSRAVKAWEQAHGHDVRLKCYPEFGCQVAETYEYWRGYTDALAGNEYQP